MRCVAHTSLAAMMIASPLVAAPSHPRSTVATSLIEIAPVRIARRSAAEILDGSEGDALRALEWIGSPVETSDGDLIGTLRGVVRSYTDGGPDRLTIERTDDTDLEVPLPGVGYLDGRVIIPAGTRGDDRSAKWPRPSVR